MCGERFFSSFFFGLQREKYRRTFFVVLLFEILAGRRLSIIHTSCTWYCQEHVPPCFINYTRSRPPRDRMLSLSCRRLTSSMLPRNRQAVLFSKGLRVTSRMMCTAKPPDDKETSSENKVNVGKSTSFYETWRPHTMKIGVGAAASLTLYGLSSFMWDMTYNIMTMSPASGTITLHI